MKRIRWSRLIAFVVFVEAVGGIGALLAGDIPAKYMALNQPPLSPPPMVFGIVWPVLYALMGIALYLIDREGGPRRRNALFWFGVQLAFNVVWPVLYFRWGLLWAAAVDLILLVVLVAVVTMLFHKINRTAAWLMIPYLAWLAFATYLNIGTALLN